MEIIRFGNRDIDNILIREPERVEVLPFGALLLDRAGIIRSYNGAQTIITGREAVDVIGQDFFNEVAHCCRNTPVQHNFRRFTVSGRVDVLMEHDLLFRGHKVAVKIHLKSHQDGQHCWMFTKVVHSGATLPTTAPSLI
jgi:photoactive yellow protein